MKILVGSYQCESNTFSKTMAEKSDFEVLRGDEALDALAAVRIFKENGFSVVPMLYAKALPSGMVKKQDYLELLKEFLDIAAENTDVDGVYMYFHGAMYVEGIGSGEEYFVKELRKILGDNIPISAACDFHGNLSDEYLKNIQALSAFRTAPHTDYDETEYRAANALIRILNEGIMPTVKRWHIPVLLADAAVTASEPYKTAMKMLEELDHEDGVVACSVLNGQPWVDAPFVGASVVLSSCENADSAYAKAQEIADVISSRKEEFCFSVPALSPEKAIEAAPSMEKPLFLSDSGDNTTAGAEGKSAVLLKKLLDSGLQRVLVTGLTVENLDFLEDVESGSEVSFSVGEENASFELSGKLVKSGTVLGFDNEVLGKGFVVRAGGVDVALSKYRTSFITDDHFSEMGLSVSDYDIVVEKMGYLWPEVSKMAKSTIFVLTPGTSTNDFDTLDYKNLTQKYFYVK